MTSKSQTPDLGQEEGKGDKQPTRRDTQAKETWAGTPSGCRAEVAMGKTRDPRAGGEQGEMKGWPGRDG